ncbi:hypothetical protein BD410DRAFT_780856 [Rickenella mellea]|uniref:Ino eighty subunit 1 n=1 Tax=Rickenella mellea TaxID=50990 RepID=A0A4Y7QM88_9AGAM|nr:hypothetical protein BD410DRAFT_780856 [Rickenella mellea]
MPPSPSSGQSTPQARCDSEGVTSSLFPHKKTLPIKRNDAEMLTRQDIQYDLLHCIFSDPQKVYTDQSPGQPVTKVTFCELYVNSLYHSRKCSKVLKDKMRDTPAFAVEFAKISLLANVGRINTTMAFFPEMKTALRTYHPVPSLQRTDGNLQDAPRIKNCLKAALLPSEQKGVPVSSLAEVMQRSRAGMVPPTSVVNLIFIMASNAGLLGRTHFDPPLDFLDLFFPVNIPSKARANAFLWLVFHYIEDGSLPNPFADDYAKEHPGMLPWLPRLSAQDMPRENVDTPEEIEWGNQMCVQRTAFLQKLVGSVEDKKGKDVFKPPQVLELAPRRPRAPRQIYQDGGDEGFRHYAPNAHMPTQGADNIPSEDVNFQGFQPERSMLQHAFHIVSTTDPLADSDEENDEHVRLDYERRLRILNRLRGRPPTPSPPPPPPHPLLLAQSTSVLHHNTNRWRHFPP